MIEVGMITFGREVARQPIFADLNRLRASLRVPGGKPELELVFVVPGSEGQADFEQFEVGRRGGKWPQIFVAVAEGVAMSNDPLEDLFDLAHRAVEFGRSRIGRRGEPIDVARYHDAISAAESALLGVRSNETKAERGWASPGYPEAQLDDAGAGVEIVLSLAADRQALDDAFRLEAELGDHLASINAGFVDGNEVDRETFVVFTYGPVLSDLRVAVEAFVRDRWKRAGGRLRLLEGADEVETLDL